MFKKNTKAAIKNTFVIQYALIKTKPYEQYAIFEKHLYRLPYFTRQY